MPPCWQITFFEVFTVNGETKGSLWVGEDVNFAFCLEFGGKVLEEGVTTAEISAICGSFGNQQAFRECDGGDGHGRVVQHRERGGGAGFQLPEGQFR